jgi:polyisoprenyl-phosphate glycosyltransferase
MVAVLFFSGVQLVFLVILGEDVGRMFNETKRRPLYLIQDLLGVDQVNETCSWRRRSEEALPGLTT